MTWNDWVGIVGFVAGSLVTNVAWLMASRPYVSEKKKGRRRDTTKAQAPDFLFKQPEDWDGSRPLQ